MCVCAFNQLCLTLCNPTDCSPPASSVQGIFQARILEWVAVSYSIPYSFEIHACFCVCQYTANGVSVIESVLSSQVSKKKQNYHD